MLLDDSRAGLKLVGTLSSTGFRDGPVTSVRCLVCFCLGRASQLTGSAWMTAKVKLIERGATKARVFKFVMGKSSTEKKMHIVKRILSPLILIFTSVLLPHLGFQNRIRDMSTEMFGKLQTISSRAAVTDFLLDTSKLHNK